MSGRNDKVRVCTEIGCPNLRPCLEHQPAPWAGSTRRATLPPDWNRRRQATFRRDGWRCTTCGHHDPTGRTLECDHTGDRNDHTRLTTLCGHGAPNNCHGRRTKQQAAAARRGHTR